MATVTTPTTPTGWSPDVTFYPAEDVVGDALIMRLGQFAGTVEGDAPSVRAPFVREDPEAAFTAEGEQITETPGQYDEVVVTTSKLAQLGKFSRETLAQEGAATLIVNSMRRGMTAQADAALLTNPDAPTGLVNIDGVVDGGSVGTSLDAVADAVTTIEVNGGQATAVIASPTAWGALSKLRTGNDSNESLLGSGTAAAQRQVLGVPVYVSNAMTTDGLLVLDDRALIRVHGQVEVARSEHAFFSADTVAIRTTFRVGWDLQRPERVVKLSTTTGEG